MKKKNLLMTTLATLSASGALLTTGASALADSYTVVKNDTLWGLSKKYGVSVSDLKKANGVSGHLIYVGQKLQIPAKSTKAVKAAKATKTSASTSTVDTTSTTHTVVKGDTLWSLAKKYGVSVKALMKTNNLSSSTILIGQSLNLRAGMTTYGVNGVTTGSSSTAASTNTASSASTTASSQAPKAKKTTTKAKSATTNTSSNSNTSASAKAQSQSTASNTSASTTTNTNTAASTATTTSSTNTASTTNTAASTNTASTANTAASTNTASSTNTAASSSQAVSQAPTASTSTASASASAITSYALTFLGVPYVWGGTTPSGFDCSGLVQYVYSHFGINLGRTTYTQQYAGTKISVASAQAGDLYFWGSYGSAYHVAIALGGGQYVMAPAPGQNVMTGSVSSYTPSFAVRVLG